jgi:hypothetical protein
MKKPKPTPKREREAPPLSDANREWNEAKAAWRARKS